MLSEHPVGGSVLSGRLHMDQEVTGHLRAPGLQLYPSICWGGMRQHVSGGALASGMGIHYPYNTFKLMCLHNVRFLELPCTIFV